MRRFLTLVCLLCLAIPAGISISGCTRNPDANYCNGAGYGAKITDVQSITLTPLSSGISIAFGQTQQSNSPTASACHGAQASVSSYTYGSSNNRLVDISPSGNICAGTWNRNTGGGIANYTICSEPDPIPTTDGLPYATAFITASAQSVTSNPVQVYVHAKVTSVSLVGPTTCQSQTTVAQLDAQACYSNGTQQINLCAPPSVTGANFACHAPAVAPNIIASGTFVAPPSGISSIVGGDYLSGGTIAGTDGQTCSLSGFNNGSAGATATVALTGTNTIADGTPLIITAGGTGATSAPTTATLSNGTATCSGTATVITGPVIGTAGQTCNLRNFNNGSSGATATVTLTGANAIASGTPLVIETGGAGATAVPTTATLFDGTATCAGTATVATTLTPVPNCTQSIGTFNYAVGTPSIASIATNTSANTVSITALQPGTTAITATLAGTGSSAGYFSTCPPKSISVTLANGQTAGTITQGVQQNLTTTVLDTNDNPITGLNLDYQSTDPIDIAAGSGGGINTTFPGVASVTAICQPSTCNPAPINEIGLFGTGLSISSNPVTITVPGTASDFVWFGAPGQSQYFVPLELLTGTVGSTVRLPYVPNSMVMDRLGNNIFFGSTHELMVFGTGTDTLGKQDPSAPGVVLAVSPNGGTLLINDQVRQVFYIYNATGGTAASFGGMGTAASWTPDSKTLYITDSKAAGAGHTDALYVYSQNTGWSTYPLAPSGLGTTNPGANSVAITIPGVGAFLSGNPTVAHTWCPSGIVGDSTGILFYPQGPQPPNGDNSVDVLTDVLAATTDGHHILGASASGTPTSGSDITLSDIALTIPSLDCLPPAANTDPGAVNTLLANGQPLSPLVLDTSVTNPPAVTADASQVNQVVPSPASNLAFVTYTPPASGATTGVKLPYYVPGTGGAAGTVGYVTLAGASASDITAPIAGAFSPDDTLFFVSTAGDNLVHYISIPAAGATGSPTDTQQISPNLPACTPGADPDCILLTAPTSNTVPASVIVVKPRSTT